ncbi:DUF5694 domain-containing protein [Tenacibaculum jejuense]|uniref:Uncharacterized protein n=1 Tax=Tenacibaculum jejuense TaxID=584609 RepID=A0A238U8J0_9FLAO|nr:DUF5694 domain-containing protein [Tenacibaculum jejuense]SNR15477.1 conserved protein of unknown function [Tenacibaculum jejuense]
MSIRIITITICLLGQTIFSQKKLIQEHFKEIKTSDVFILGSFHFANPGLDTYKQKHAVNIFSEEKQKELKELLRTIKKFAPTKIAVEWRASKQKKLDSLYNAYIKGNFKLKSNEIYQIGFRLGKLLGHKKIYAVDASARNFKSDLSKKEHEAKQAYFIDKADEKMLKREMNIDKTYFSLYEKEDKLKTEVSLLEFFRVLNNDDVINQSHGHYLIGDFKMGEREKNDYYGADRAIWWYSRNLRIFQNLLNINTPGEDKVFVLIGAGHLPILNFLAKASVDFKITTLEQIINQ